jgi:hypothetical protein
MGAISRADLRLCGLARGHLDRRGRPVADGPRGPLALPCDQRLDGPDPADGRSTVALVRTMCDLPGSPTVRTTREATPRALRRIDDTSRSADPRRSHRPITTRSP